jgi:hypothetical protein
MPYLDNDSPEPEYPTWVFDAEAVPAPSRMSAARYKFLRDAVYPKYVARVDDGNGFDRNTGERILSFSQWFHAG